MAEKEYIEREAALDRIREYTEEYGEPEENGLHNLKWCAMMEAQMVLTDIPAADVRPVVRGKWISADDGETIVRMKYGEPQDSCKCSVCSEWLVASDEYDVKGNFCPNCGADMREES